MQQRRRTTDLADEREDRAFKALGHAERRAILRVVGEGERPVNDVADATGLDQPATSQHLRVLRDAGLVEVRVDGNRRIYSLDFERVAGLRAVLDTFWSDKLEALKAAAEANPQPDVEAQGSRPAGAYRRGMTGSAS